jgi:oligoribonuclease NrnB/cAMP/cGMP phosphodiesterase (DHH superfamily)
MDYHLYFHDDFDGIASASLLLNFFSSRLDNVVSFTPLNYTPDLKDNWLHYNLKKPFVIIDFRYHPNADWWFDHHPTTFFFHEWKENFVNDNQHNFNPEAKSCFGQILNFLKNKHGFTAPVQLNDFEKQADIIDSAGFEKPEDATRFESTQELVYLLVDNLYRLEVKTNRDAQMEVIRALAFGDIKKLVEVDYKEEIEYLKNRVKNSFNLYKNNVKIIECVGFLDATNFDMAYKSFIGYTLYPELKYTVSISKENVSYHVHVGWNQWFRGENKINIANLMNKYGGGGHDGVGGLEAETYAGALKIAEEIVEYLNANG